MPPIGQTLTLVARLRVSRALVLQYTLVMRSTLVETNVKTEGILTKFT